MPVFNVRSKKELVNILSIAVIDVAVIRVDFFTMGITPSWKILSKNDLVSGLLPELPIKS